MNNVNDTKAEQKQEPIEPAGNIRTSRRKFLTATAVSTAAIGLGTVPAKAMPNGTRPTILTITSLVAVKTTQMRVAGRLTTLTGVGLPGMRVDVYYVFEAAFGIWASIYTDNNGYFNLTCSKIPVGARIQVVVDGNGAYSQPYPTYNRV